MLSLSGLAQVMGLGFGLMQRGLKGFQTFNISRVACSLTAIFVSLMTLLQGRSTYWPKVKRMLLAPMQRFHTQKLVTGCTGFGVRCDAD